MSVLPSVTDEHPPDPHLVHALQTRVAEQLQQTHDTAHQRTSLVNDEVQQWLRDNDSPHSDMELNRAVLAALSGYGRLQPLLDRADVENIHIHGHDHVVVELADGQLAHWPHPVADSDDDLLALIADLCARHGPTAREFSPAQPVANLRLPAGGPLGARLAAVREVVDRPRIAIRRHRLAHTGLADLTERGTVSSQVQHLLRCAVAAGVNMLVTGGPAAGKTTLLRALCRDIPREEHVVTVEDDLELGLHLDTEQHPLVTPLEARTTNGDGTGEITLDALLKQALRHSPSRVIVGEVRAGEITALLRALGNGAAGGMGTLHATNAQAVPDRIAALGQLADPPLPIPAAHQWTAQALDLIVHLTREDRDGHRHREVAEVVEVGPVGDAASPDLTTLFAPDHPGGPAYPVCPPSPELLARLRSHGLDAAIFDQDEARGDLR